MRITPSQLRTAKTKSALIGFVVGLCGGFMLTVFSMIHHRAL